MSKSPLTPSDLRIVRFVGNVTDARNCNYQYEMSEEEFHQARNALVRVCKRHGRTGPTGEYQPNEETGRLFEQGDEPPEFFVVDDQLNDSRDLLIGIFNPSALTVDWVMDVARTLSEMPGWAVWLRNLADVGAAILPSVILVIGEELQDVETAEELVEQLKEFVQTE